MTDVKEVAYDALREMYDEAEPSADFDEILENPNEQPEEWYENHHLPSERQKEIVEKHCEENDLNKRERSQVVFTAITAYGPTSNPEKV